MSITNGVGVNHQLNIDHHSQSFPKEIGATINPTAISIRNVNSWYGSHQVLEGVCLEIKKNVATAFIGPSGCGKSTMLRSLNRLNDRITGFKLQGDINIEGESILDKKVDLLQLRRRVGIVFQKPNPFPKTIFENIALGLRAHYGIKGMELEGRIESALKEVALWEEVEKDFRTKSGFSLSGGQQQRLCIARALAIEPQILLMDEPCSALDPVSTRKIEELINNLSANRTVVIVTHNMQQAQRVSAETAFFMLGKVVEFGPTADIFNDPKELATRDYVNGRFG